MKRVIRFLSVAIVVLAGTGCYGSGSAYVGVYGAPVYAPGAWGGYPYPGRYPPYGGGVWVGVPVCCDEQEEQQPEAPQEGHPEAPRERSEPTITIQGTTVR